MSEGSGGDRKGSGSSKGHVNIYTDGACSRNGQPGARAGVGVYSDHDPSLNVSEPMGGRQTNQRAELEAASRGINDAKAAGYDSVTVNTDSRYVIDGATKWMPNWEREGWTRDVANRREFEELRNSIRGIDVNFKYVPRAENPADRLARHGAAKRAIVQLCRKIR